MSVIKVQNKVEKAKKRSESVLSQFTETQQRLAAENQGLEDVKSDALAQIEKHEATIQALLDIVDEASAEQEQNTKAIDGINFVLNGNN